MQERLHEEPPRVAQHRDEEVHRHLLAGDPDPPLAEVDLHLPARRRLEPHRGELGRELLAAALRPTARCTVRTLAVDASLREEVGHDDRVAVAGAVEQRQRLR